MFDDRDRHGISFDDDFFKRDTSDLFKDWDKSKEQWDRDVERSRSHSVFTMSVSIFVYVIAAVVVLAVLLACCCSKRRRTRGQVISPPPPPPAPNQPAAYPQQQYAPYPLQPAHHPVAVTFPVQSASPYPHAAPYPSTSPYPAVTPYPTATPYPSATPYPTVTPYAQPAAPSAPDAHALPPSYDQVMMGQHQPSPDHQKQPPFNPNAPR